MSNSYSDDQLVASNVKWEFVNCLLRTPYRLISGSLNDLNAIKYLQIIPKSQISLVQFSNIRSKIQGALETLGYFFFFILAILENRKLLTFLICCRSEFLTNVSRELTEFEIERLKFFEPIFRLFE